MKPPERIDITALKPEERRQFASLLMAARYRVYTGSYKVPSGKTRKTVHYVEYDKPEEALQ